MKDELQRKEVGSVAPPVVSEALRAPGRSLEAESRSSVREGFGHDFGRVAVLQRQPVDKPSEPSEEEKKKKQKKALETKAAQEHGFTVTTDEAGVKVKNKFKVGASVKIPLASDLSFGAVALLQSVEVKSEGSKESEEPIPVGGTDLSTLQTSIALDLLRLKIATLGIPGLSFESGLVAKGSAKQLFGPTPGATGELGAEASGKLGYTSPSLVPDSLGSLKLSSELKGTAGVTQPLGDTPGTPPVPAEGAKPSASLSGSAKLSAESPRLSAGRNKVRFVGDVGPLFTVKKEPGKTSTSAGVGGGIGLKIETAKKIEISIQGKASYEEAVTPARSKAVGGNAVVEVKF